MDKSFICIIKDGVYRHPIYVNEGDTPQLLGYFPIGELSDTLTKYSNIYKIYDVKLDGYPPFMAGIREQIYHENTVKYGQNNLNITLVRKDIKE